MKVDETEDTQTPYPGGRDAQSEVAELTDAYLRLRADFDNYRRRTRQEMETIDEANAKLISCRRSSTIRQGSPAGADSPDRGFTAALS